MGKELFLHQWPWYIDVTPDRWCYKKEKSIPPSLNNEVANILSTSDKARSNGTVPELKTCSCAWRGTEAIKSADSIPVGHVAAAVHPPFFSLFMLAQEWREQEWIQRNRKEWHWTKTFTFGNFLSDASPSLREKTQGCRACSSATFFNMGAVPRSSLELEDVRRDGFEILK